MNATNLPSRAARVARAVIVASIATIIAATSHMLAGGNTPTFIGFLATAVIALPVVTLLLGKRLRVPGMLLAVGFTQFLFHAIFVYAGTGQQNVSSTPMPAHAEHMGMLMQFVPNVSVAQQPFNSDLTSTGFLGSSADVLMWLAHAVSALLTVWLICKGESALSKFAVSLRRVFFAHPVLATHLNPLSLQLAFSSVQQNFQSIFLSRSLFMRGPPCLVETI